MIQCEPKIYNKSLFEGVDFACELHQISKAVSEENTRKVIQLSMKNLKKAYGDNFLSNPDIKATLCKRMGIPLTTHLTEKLVENKIVENTLRVKKQLKELALQEALKIKDPKDIERLEKEIPTYKSEKLKKEISEREKDKNHLTLEDLKKLYSAEEAKELHTQTLKKRSWVNQVRRKFLKIEQRLSKKETQQLLSSYITARNKPERVR